MRSEWVLIWMWFLIILTSPFKQFIKKCFSSFDIGLRRIQAAAAQDSFNNDNAISHYISLVIFEYVLEP